MKKSLIIPSAVILIILACLFYLTFQKPEDTVELSNRVAHFPVVSAFLERMGAYVSWSVRQWAHVFEFFIVGTGFSVLYIFITKHTWTMMAAALSTCMVVSLVDQSIRIFIVGRHFDAFDLVLDAIGYVVAVLIFGACRKLVSWRNREKHGNK